MTYCFVLSYDGDSTEVRRKCETLESNALALKIHTPSFRWIAEAFGSRKDFVLWAIVAMQPENMMQSPRNVLAAVSLLAIMGLTLARPLL